MRPTPAKIKLSNRVANEGSNKEEIEDWLTEDENIIGLIGNTINNIN